MAKPASFPLMGWVERMIGIAMRHSSVRRLLTVLMAGLVALTLAGLSATALAAPPSRDRVTISSSSKTCEVSATFQWRNQPDYFGKAAHIVINTAHPGDTVASNNEAVVAASDSVTVTASLPTGEYFAAGFIEIAPYVYAESTLTRTISHRCR
jgi:hypothetical protein